MTEHRTAEERISMWLEDEARGQIPDRVLDEVFKRTRASSQRRGSSAWRPFPMTRPIPALVAVGAAAIVIVLSVVLLPPIRSDQQIAVAPSSASTNVDGGFTTATADFALDAGDFEKSLPQLPLPSPRVLETGFWTGSIEIATSDRTITGELRLDSNHELAYSPTGPPVNHAWGSLTGRVDGVSCTGSLAYSFYRDGPVGGTIFMRCADGSYLGGELTSVAIASAGANWRLTAQMDGVYRPAD
jgi:hypothetical protein